MELEFRFQWGSQKLEPKIGILNLAANYGWLLCVRRMGSDIIDVIIASWTVIVVIIISLPSPAEEQRAETCEGGRGCNGDDFGIDTAPLLW